MLNKFIFISILGLGLNLGLNVFAQTVVDPNSPEAQPITNTQTQVQPDNSNQLNTQAPPQNAEIHDTEAPKVNPSNVPVHAEQQLENEVDEEFVRAQKQQKDLEDKYKVFYQGEKKKKDTTEPLFDHEAAIKNMAQMMNRDIKPQELKKMKIHEAVEKALIPIQMLSEEEFLYQLKENTKGTKTGIYLAQFPRLTVVAVKIIKDKKAMPNASKVLEDRDRLIRFGSLMMLTILLGFFLKRILSTKEGSFLVHMLFFMARTLIMFGVRISIIIYFFGTDLGPLYDVIVHNL